VNIHAISTMHTAVLPLIIFTLTAWFSQAHAQPYQCKRGNGATYQSNTPCPVYFGPTENRAPSYRSDTNYSRSLPAEQELQHLSPECSRLYEGVRTAQARGVTYDVIQALRKELSEKCTEELAEARQKVSNANREKKMTAQEEKKSAQQQVAMSKEDEARKFRQCAEMRGALSNRKAKANPSDGEKNDVLVFEQRYRERCS
jgi:hypothetical protein